MGSPYCNGGLLSLAVAADGTACGGLGAKTSFMDLRDQPIESATSEVSGSL